ncbi:SapB/AmfS family lanthipeptide [Micromonospora sp. CPCC 205371]|jgi:hypothetical protein|uniref:Lanthionine-containing peptide SapB n=1 Tax=Phytohabitans aurantiacus TaxID=3016789 RepID=A0ABQ5R5G9_9ACTN|nr:SapB/AmfS family lanthipeptide [Phytohabitans aurantiacus]MCW6008022.1 SapB/AmfS family lanthipeptide [Micromonospora sp. CPCC 205371]GLI01603.1 hypothetical protein Pa4123_68790 [Phytohabitans aurantiacus]
MALLDLQGMDTPSPELAADSSNSKHSCGGSELSVTLCGESDLSVLLCK